MLVAIKTPDSPQACPECLRRGRLIAHLAPYIERTTSAMSGPRAVELLDLSNEDLVAAVAPDVATGPLDAVASIPAQALTDAVRAADCWARCCHDPLYPERLRDLAAAPRVLFGRGDPELIGTRARAEDVVSIVGARRATSYGREVARTLGRDLASAGLTVLSGLAFGIDACAHRGALESGRTVAVLGCGPDVAYPAAHRSLWRRIQESGLILSELPPGTGAWRWTFPARNRLVAALAGMTVVVEAAERSGSILTADFAADLGRELGAVPGPVTSRCAAGPNQLIVDGAHPVRGAEDVLDAMHGPGVRRTEPAPGPSPHSLRRSAEQIIGEDRVPAEALRDLVWTYGGERA